MQQAEGLISGGDLATAEGLLREIRARDPGNLKVIDDLAQVLMERGSREEARDLLEEGLDLAPDAPAFNLRLAELEAERGELARALERARTARDFDQRNLRPWLVMADYLALLGRGAELSALYEEARQHLEGEPGLHAAFGLLLAQNGEPTAEETLKRALEGDNAAVRTSLAAIALARSDWPAARDWAQRAVALDPGDAAAWNSLGFALDELGRQEEALAAYERALGADRGYWPAAHNLGLARLGRGDPGGATMAFEEVLQLQPGHVDAHFQLTLLYAGPLGDPIRALDHLDSCLSNAPDHPRAPQLGELRARLVAVLSEVGQR